MALNKVEAAVLIVGLMLIIMTTSSPNIVAEAEGIVVDGNPNYCYHHCSEYCFHVHEPNCMDRCLKRCLRQGVL